MDKLANELRPGESLGDCLQRQMAELGTNNYWEAVALERDRREAAIHQQQFWRGVFGFQPSI
jgi:hypothetical protein